VAMLRDQSRPSPHPTLSLVAFRHLGLDLVCLPTTWSTLPRDTRSTWHSRQ